MRAGTKTALRAACAPLVLPHPGAVLLWSFYNPPRQEQVQIARWGVGRWILLTGLTGARRTSKGLKLYFLYTILFALIFCLHCRWMLRTRTLACAVCCHFSPIYTFICFRIRYIIE
jgi:hypothetical protein